MTEVTQKEFDLFMLNLLTARKEVKHFELEDEWEVWIEMLDNEQRGNEVACIDNGKHYINKEYEIKHTK